MRIDNQVKFLEVIREWNREYGEYPKEFPVTVEEAHGILCINSPQLDRVKNRLRTGAFHMFGVKLTLYEEEGA